MQAAITHARCHLVWTLLVLIWLIPGGAFGYEKQILEVSQNIIAGLDPMSSRTVAVSDFTDLQGNVTELGRFLAEELSVALASSTAVEVVDRAHLRVLLAEHELSSSGLIDPSTAKELGKIAGVDALVTGTVTPFGDSVRLALKVLNTATAKMVGATTTSVPRTSAIEELLGRGIGNPVAITRRPPAGSPTSGSSSLGSSYQSGRLRVEAQSLGVASDAGVATLAVRITNLTDNELMLGLEKDSARLVDDRGNVLLLQRCGGLPVFHDWHASGLESYSRLDARAHLIVVLAFRIESEATLGKVFSFGASLFEHRGDRKGGQPYNRISIGLSQLVPTG